jgi:hypothetical protein
MTMPTSLATQLRPTTPNRYKAYLIWSLAATISYHLLVATDKPVVLAGLIPMLATLFVQYILLGSCSVQVSYTFALTLASFALGLVAHNILPYLMDEPDKMTVEQPPVTQFGLALCFLSDLEWIRMRFYLADRQASHPDLIVLPRLYHYQAWLNTLSRQNTRIAIILRHDWNPILQDVLFIFGFCLSSFFAIEAIQETVNPNPGEHAHHNAVFGYNVVYTSTAFWSKLFGGVVLLRPVRLIIGFLYAFAMDWCDSRAKPEVAASTPQEESCECAS